MKALNKKVPERTCTVCNTKGEKKDFIRIVRNKQMEVSIDLTGKAAGRGAYICKDLQCLEKLIKTKRLEKIFETKIENELYENLRGVIIDSTK